jgi:hypothetical protein
MRIKFARVKYLKKSREKRGFDFRAENNFSRRVQSWESNVEGCGRGASAKSAL